MKKKKKSDRQPAFKQVDVEDENICAICCETFSTRKGEETRSNFTYNSHLQKLCASIITSHGGNEDESPGTSGNQWWSAKSGAVTPLLCHKCLSLVSAVWNGRERLVGMEVEVRKLQMEILKLLRNLQQGVESFKEEMETVERTIRDSSGKENKLDEFFFSRCWDEDQAENIIKSKINDALQFREKIMAVMGGLREFSGSLQIISATPTSLSPQKEGNYDEGNFPDLNSPFYPPSGTSSPQPAQEVEFDEFGATSESEEKSDDGDLEWEPAQDMVSDEDKDKTRMKRKSSRVKTGKITTKKQKYYESGSDDDEDEVGYHRKSSVNKDKNANKDLLNDVMEPILASIDFTSMTKFKKKLIIFSIKKAEKSRLNIMPENWRKIPFSSSGLESIDPLKTHFMTYDPTTDILNLAGLEMKIDGEEESVECLECGLKFPNRSALGNAKKFHILNMQLHDHILGFHLKLFTCPHCPSVSLTTHKTFRLHARSHLNHFQCDICGRPLKNGKILKSHKWSHMNEEEKSEALKAQGIEDGLTPQERHAKKWRDLDKNRFQCSTCGRGFPLQSQLQKHEATHTEEKNHMCYNCGKSFKFESYLLTHQKYGCFPGEEAKELAKRFHCDQCPRKFMFLKKLKKHKFEQHEDLPLAFKCSICDKGFKTEKKRKSHEKSHSNVRPFACGKGCGKTFKNGYGVRRHETTCTHVKTEMAEMADAQPLNYY